MRTKSAYREKPAENIPSHDEITQRLIEDTINPGERQLNNLPQSAPLVEPSAGAEAAPQGEADSPAVAEALRQQAQADDSRNVLLQQLRAAQEAQRQQYSRPRPPQTREEWVAALMRESGTTEAEANFLLDRPPMLTNPKAMQKAMAEIQAAGVKRDDSPEYFQAVESAFQHHLQRKQEKAAAKAESQPTPKFFQPPPAPPQEPPEHAQAAIYSAPVSREAGGGGGYQPSPSSVRLSPQEREAAKMAGISETEYAHQKLRMLQAQRDGTIQR
jgi:hypothetical protein